MTTAQADVGEITYEQCPAIDYMDMKTGKTIDQLFAPAVLWATIDGLTYEIVEPNWAQYPQMWVRDVVDLDGDLNSFFADYISHYYAHAQPSPWPAARESLSVICQSREIKLSV